MTRTVLIRELPDPALVITPDRIVIDPRIGWDQALDFLIAAGLDEDTAVEALGDERTTPWVSFAHVGLDEWTVRAADAGRARFLNAEITITEES